MRIVYKIKSALENTSLTRILVLALALRLIWYLIILCTNPEGFWLYDSNGYWNIAYNLKEYGVYSRDAQEPLLPDYFRTPLYPFLIYPTLWLDETGNSIPIIQILLDCITCYLIYKLIFSLTSSLSYAKAGSFLYAVHIPAIVTSNYILTESVFAFLICLFVWLFLRLLNNYSFKYALLCGAIGGLCVMCKPLGFVLIFPAVGFLLFNLKLNSRSLLSVICLISCFYLLQLPWMARNKHVFGRYFNSVIGEHLLLGYHTSYVYSKANQVDFSYAQDLLRGKFDNGLNYDPYKRPYEYAKHIEKECYKILWNNKWIFLKVHSFEVFKFFVWPMGKYVGAQLGLSKPYTPFVMYLFVAIQVIVSAFIYISLLLYLWKCVRQKIRPPVFWFFIIGIILLFSQFTTMPYTDARMRFPTDPLLILVCMVSIYFMKTKMSDNQRIASDSIQ